MRAGFLKLSCVTIFTKLEEDEHHVSQLYNTLNKSGKGGRVLEVNKLVSKDTLISIISCAAAS